MVQDGGQDGQDNSDVLFGALANAQDPKKTIQKTAVLKQTTSISIKELIKQQKHLLNIRIKASPTSLRHTTSKERGKKDGHVEI